jgi:hypothetical protein
VERGDGQDPDRAVSATLDNWWIPDSLRLHWQYHWPYGRDRFLVATDGAGRLGSGIVRFSWRPLPGDSLRVWFGARYEAAVFLLERADGGYQGEVRIVTDAGGVTRAPVRLTRRECDGAASNHHVTTAPPPVTTCRPARAAPDTTSRGVRNPPLIVALGRSGGFGSPSGPKAPLVDPAA